MLQSCLVCRCQALHDEHSVGTLAAVMQNIHIYYSQFQHLVQDSLQKSLAPIEKHLKVSNLAIRKRVLLSREISL